MARNLAAKYSSIDDYNSSHSADVRCILQEIREIVKRKVPDASETISYQMPAFKLDRTFIYFAAFKNHIGVYPPVTNDPDLIAELLPYANEKGNLKFSLTDTIPFELIARVAVSLSKQYLE